MEQAVRLEELKKKVMDGGMLEREEALCLVEADLDWLCRGADEIREHFCQDQFDVCSIINGKSGKCSEDCKYCAQAGCHSREVESHPLVDTGEIMEGAKRCEEQGILRYSVVTSGRRLSKREIEKLCDSLKEVSENVDIKLCTSVGLLDEEDYRKLKEAGVTQIHNNLETSRRYFPEICTTHTYEDKLEAIRAAQRAGLAVCSGGIVGIGESMEDRIDMALTLRDLGVQSVPVNMLNPIPGTPYEGTKPLDDREMRRIIAIFRFLLPTAFIRLAGGRGLMQDKGEGCLRSGANASITGDMLTTSGITVETDMKLLEKLHFRIARQKEQKCDTII